MTAHDATPARGDVVTGVHDRHEWMLDAEWAARCWADAVKGDGQNSPLANDLVRVFKMFDEERKGRDTLARRVRALEDANTILDNALSTLRDHLPIAVGDANFADASQEQCDAALTKARALRATEAPDA